MPGLTYEIEYLLKHKRFLKLYKEIEHIIKYVELIDENLFIINNLRQKQDIVLKEIERITELLEIIKDVEINDEFRQILNVALEDHEQIKPTMNLVKQVKKLGYQQWLDNILLNPFFDEKLR